MQISNTDIPFLIRASVRIRDDTTGAVANSVRCKFPLPPVLRPQPLLRSSRENSWARAATGWLTRAVEPSPCAWGLSCQMTPYISIGAVMLAPSALLACSAVTIALGGKIVLGSNNDNQQTVKLSVAPARDGLFGRICIVRETVPGWTPFALRCMNDHGVALTMASVPEGKTPYDPDKPHFRHNFLEKIASEAENVKQVVSMVRAYTLPEKHGVNVHMMVAHRSGDSAVIEWVDNEVRVLRRDSEFQVMTNSLLSKLDPSPNPKTRLARGALIASAAKEASIASVAAVLKEMTVHGIFNSQEVGTNESVAWDLTGRKIAVFFKRDFDHPLYLDFDAEMANGARVIELRKLCPNPVPFETGWRAEYGPYVPKTAAAVP